ncbi:MAG: bifunctional diaminohydroxyphosphoribosylaminopyrimidine deaminase/5-amino-6-(5-phosphoribosylamino)uracil reductase RibD [bacterium]|nr:bifunctional diaminohydroxyphosphoribosylaminopyrimidine deaminase/5-amino-6-(5-phosphoribosylamino)uracil reductase RibD [bacterium]MDD3805176.1 bifunctional diaminohydroxyphosphoribosylaminopyrimidine deaminase/5-amino-6-(5-phosphoribosylamino)uracil reductase RibD [bacterium]
MTTDADKRRFMSMVLSMARRSRGKVSPNPLVGAVVVRDGKVIGRGRHAVYGGLHAEVAAIADAGDCRGAEIFVNLEPCAHHGKTPPCVEAVIAAGIKSVYVGMVDPNPLVAGAGLERLRRAGIYVENGILEEKCRDLNRGFVKYITSGLPFVAWKAAASLDGRTALADGQSKWITSQASRRCVQALRVDHDAVMVGSGTVLADNPRLDVRIPSRFHPVRIIVDSMAVTPPDARLFNGNGKIFIAVTRNAPAARVEALSKKGARIIEAGNERHVDLSALLRLLPRLGVATVLLESGSRLSTAMLIQGLIDEAFIFMGPIFLGGESLPLLGPLDLKEIDGCYGLEDITWRRIGDDMLCRGRLRVRDVDCLPV